MRHTNHDGQTKRRIANSEMDAMDKLALYIVRTGKRREIMDGLTILVEVSSNQFDHTADEADVRIGEILALFDESATDKQLS